jgi:hypothetical protein
MPASASLEGALQPAARSREGSRAASADETVALDAATPAQSRAVIVASTESGAPGWLLNWLKGCSM